jgi:uncharacterized protein
MEHKKFSFEVKSVTDTGTFEGYGSVYDVVDQGDDIVVKGAFTESLQNLAQKGRMPALLWQHDASQPIGVYTKITEDENGLYVCGQLALKTQKGAEAYELMKMGAISGLSIGFMTKDDSYDSKSGIRTIIKGDLWEVSVVTFPMNDQARIDAVKSIDEIIDLKSAETYLRDSCGLSRSAATAFVSKLNGLKQSDSGLDKEAKQLVDALTMRVLQIKA